MNNLPSRASLNQLAECMLLCFLAKRPLLVRTAAQGSLLTPPIDDPVLDRFYEGPRHSDEITGRFGQLYLSMSDQRMPVLHAYAEWKVKSSWMNENFEQFGVVVEKRGFSQLCEAFLDRCAMSTNFNLHFDSIAGVLADLGSRCTLSSHDLSLIRQDIREISAQVKMPLRKKLVDVIRATRPDDPQFRLQAVRSKIQFGLSPRAIIDSLHLAVAYAVIHGHRQLRPEEIVAAFPFVAEHRIIPTAAADQDHFDFIPALTELARTVMCA